MPQIKSPLSTEETKGNWVASGATACAPTMCIVFATRLEYVIAYIVEAKEIEMHY